MSTVGMLNNTKVRKNIFSFSLLILLAIYSMLIDVGSITATASMVPIKNLDDTAVKYAIALNIAIGIQMGFENSFLRLCMA